MLNRHETKHKSASLPSGHSGWVVGDDPVAVVDWHGASNHAKSSPR